MGLRPGKLGRSGAAPVNVLRSLHNLAEPDETRTATAWARRGVVGFWRGRRRRAGFGFALGTDCIFRGALAGSRQIEIGGAACPDCFPRCRGGRTEVPSRRPRVWRCAGFWIRVPNGRVERRRRKRGWPNSRGRLLRSKFQRPRRYGMRRFVGPRRGRWRGERARIFALRAGGTEGASLRRREKSTGAR